MQKLQLDLSSISERSPNWMTAQSAVESLEWDILSQDCQLERSSIYVEDRIPWHSLHVFLIALSTPHGVSKYTVSGDCYRCPADLVASLCAQCRIYTIFVCWSCQVMDVVHELCVEYLWISSGHCVVRLDWVFDCWVQIQASILYIVWTQSWVLKQGWDLAYDRFKTQWKKGT